MNHFPETTAALRRLAGLVRHTIVTELLSMAVRIVPKDDAEGGYC